MEVQNLGHTWLCSDIILEGHKGPNGMLDWQGKHFTCYTIAPVPVIIILSQASVDLTSQSLEQHNVVMLLRWMLADLGAFSAMESTPCL